MKTQPWQFLFYARFFLLSMREITIRLILAGSVLCLLSSCKQENHSSLYLLQNLRVLEAEYDRCQSKTIQTREQHEQCVVINGAAAKVVDMLRQQRSDPEKFGYQVLMAEMSLQELQDNVKAISILKEQQTSKDQVTLMDARLHDAKVAYQAKQVEVKFLLNIMGISTPE